MPPKPEIFTPFKQSDVHYLYLLVRTAGDPNHLAGPIRGIVTSLDPDQPVTFRTLTERLDHAMRQPRILARTVGLFAGIALALALIGVYGVTSYGVAQRTKEFGIRSALGASPRRILRDVFIHTARLALTGILMGSAAAFAFTRFLSQFLFGVSPYDVSTFLCSAAAILVVAVMAASPSGGTLRVETTRAPQYPAMGLHQEFCFTPPKNKIRPFQVEVVCCRVQSCPLSHGQVITLVWRVPIRRVLPDCRLLGTSECQVNT